MSGTVDTLIEMGFTKERAELAVSRSGSEDIEVAMEWLLAHEEEIADTPNQQTPDPPEQLQSQSEGPDNPPEQADVANNEQDQTESQAVKSIKCDDCGKLFRTQEEVEFHATKSGHENFSESTEEKKALSENEKKDQLSKIEAKLRQRRLEREAREKQEAVDKERNRIKSGKELLEAKKKHDELEMKKIVEQRKREKEDERLARQKVKEQIEQDKLARKAKFSGQPMEVPIPEPVAASPPQTKAAPASYSEVMLQIKLTDGTSLHQKFGVKEPLSAVRVFVQMNRKDGDGPFYMMTAYPKKIFGPEDYDIPLESLGLGPRAILIVSKT